MTSDTLLSSSSEYCENISRVIRQQDFVETFRLQNLFCDFVIKAGNERYNCHKLVLAATVPYFETLLSSAFLETSTGEVKFPEHMADSLDVVIKYIYTGSINISVSNVLAVHRVGSYLGINDLVDDCDDFINRNFSLISETDRFLSIECIELLRIIESNKLQANEEFIWEAVMKWVKHDLERVHSLPKLIEQVKFDLINPTYLWQNIAQDDLLTSSTQCKDFIYNVLGNRLIQFAINETYPNKSRFVRDIYVLGGVVDGLSPTKHILRYGTQDVKWVQIQPMSEPISSFGAIELHKNIYTVGGYGTEPNYLTGSTFGLKMFITDVQKWLTLCNLRENRYALGVCSVSNHIYACGGKTSVNSGPLNSVEFYDLGVEHWTTTTPMIENRANVKVVYMEGSIWAMGGIDSKGKALESVERFDPREGRWSMCCSMLLPRCKHDATVLESKIYVCSYKSFEEFDPRNNKWSFLLPMLHQRSATSLIVSGGMIWAIGGKTQTVEIYDKRKNEWTLGTPLPWELSDHCAVVLH